MEFEWWMLILPIALVIEIAKRIWGKDHGRSGNDHTWHDDGDSGWEFDFDLGSDDGDGD